MFRIFKSPFAIRVFGTPEVINGYSRYPFTKKEALLDVQETGDKLESNEAGDGRVTRLTVYSEFPFTPADRERERPGDQLLYRDQWFECTSSTKHIHTPSRHHVSTFTAIPGAYHAGGETV